MEGQLGGEPANFDSISEKVALQTFAFTHMTENACDPMTENVGYSWNKLAVEDSKFIIPSYLYKSSCPSGGIYNNMLIKIQYSLFFYQKTTSSLDQHLFIKFFIIIKQHKILSNTSVACWIKR